MVYLEYHLPLVSSSGLVWASPHVLGWVCSCFLHSVSGEGVGTGCWILLLQGSCFLTEDREITGTRCLPVCRWSVDGWGHARCRGGKGEVLEVEGGPCDGSKLETEH